MGDISQKDEVVLIVLTVPEQKGLLDRIKKEFPNYEVIYHEQRYDPRRKLGALGHSDDAVPAELWRRATILVTLATFPAKLEDAPRLKVVHLVSAGINQITSHPLYTDSKVTVTTSSGIHGPPIAEWTIMSVLAGTKNFATMYENQKREVWDSDRTGLRNTPDWVGGVVGVAGYGSIGRQVARVFHGLGAQVHAFTASPRPTDESKRDDGYIVPGTGDPDGTVPTAWYSGKTKGELHEFLRSGIGMLFVSVPLTAATKYLIGQEELEVLYQSAREGLREENGGKEVVADGEPLPGHAGTFVVNISRGQIIEQGALVEYLNAGKLRGAALDVTDPEPLPKDNELWKARNTIVTPHISGLMAQYMPRVMDVLRVNLERLEKGQKLLNEVNRGKGY